MTRTNLAERTTAQKVTVTLAGAAVFAALAAILALAKAAVPFPLIPYLQIDFSEIPIYIAFFLFGPFAAIISSVVQWIFLNVTGSDAPLGPAIKFAAVVSTLGGLWLGSAVYGRIKGNKAHPSLAILMMFGSGIVWRVAAMTVVNYIVLIYIGPIFFGVDYIGFAKATIERSTGWKFGSEGMVLAYTLLFTAVYNIVNLLVAAIPAGLIASPIASSFKHITSFEAWLARNMR
ncbi:MAG: ECF transporter S component [Candidatus Bathyarchaeia archaeon]